jgi:hypothetical protein
MTVFITVFSLSFMHNILSKQAFIRLVNVIARILNGCFTVTEKQCLRLARGNRHVS